MHVLLLCLIAVLATAPTTTAEKGAGAPINGNITKVASIDLGLAQTRFQAATAGQGDMVYSLQQNDTLVAVNVSSATVAFKVQVNASRKPDSASIYPTPSGYVALAPGFRPRKTIVVVDPSGVVVGSYASQLGIAESIRSHRHTLYFVVRVTCPGASKRSPVYNCTNFVSMDLSTGIESTIFNSTQIADLDNAQFFSSQLYLEGETTILLKRPMNWSRYFSGGCSYTKGNHCHNQLFAYNYVTGVTEWTIDDVTHFVGSSKDWIFVGNRSETKYTPWERQLLIYNRTAMARVWTIKKVPHQDFSQPDFLGFIPVIDPTATNISFLSCGSSSMSPSAEVNVMHLWTGEMVSKAYLAVAGVCFGALSGITVVGSRAVAWTSSSGFHSVGFPDTALNSTQLEPRHYPYQVYPLQKAGLVLGIWNDRMEARDATTGAVTFQGDLVFTRGIPTTPYIRQEDRVLVLSNGAAVEVFRF